MSSVVKSSPYLEENLKFIAASLGPNTGEQPRDMIRRYFATGFYKQRAFQCLVYLHRYYEGTLARMRTEYVIPPQGQIAARIENNSKATKPRRPVLAIAKNCKKNRTASKSRKPNSARSKKN